VSQREGEGGEEGRVGGGRTGAAAGAERVQHQHGEGWQHGQQWQRQQQQRHLQREGEHEKERREAARATAGSKGGGSRDSPR
jgi:hypothetical protein